MASPTEGSDIIELDEIEGEETGSRNYRFAKVGEPVPIKSDNASEFNPECLPSRPLAVSERFRLLFVAHPQGFCVTRTKDVMESAKEIKGKQSVQELSLVDVSIGQISILALSTDESVLAACMATHVHFFAVSALLHKETKASYSVPLDESICIKDFRWSRKATKDYVILAANGTLYRGSGQAALSYVTEDVDAVDWSVKGNFVAVARKNRVSILSSQFKEKVSFLLPFQSVSDDSDVTQFIKVDSIQWMRPDCIAVGCFQLNEDGEEENYIVQVITSRGRRITDVSSKPSVLSFSCVFMDFCPDAVSARNGPHLFLSYLDSRGLAFFAIRNLSSHVRLFCWSMENGNNEVATVDVLNDAWNLRVDAKGDGEENVIIGLSVDKVSHNENVKLTLGDEETEVSPCCVIVGLTIDGNISVFHFASAAGALVQAEGCASDEDDDDPRTSPKPELALISSSGDAEIRGPTPLTREAPESGGTEMENKGDKAPAAKEFLPFHANVRSQENTVSEITEQRKLVNSQIGKPETTQSAILKRNNYEENQSAFGDNQSIGSLSGKVERDSSPPSTKFYPPSISTVGPLNNLSATKMENARLNSNARTDGAKFSDERFLSPAFDRVGNSARNTLQSSGGLRHPLDLQEKGKPSLSFSSFGQPLSMGQGNQNSAPAYPVAQPPFGESVTLRKTLQPELKKGSSDASAPGLQYPAQNPLKKFGNVEEMAKKLDKLLEGIEGAGGFRDASITSQTQFLEGLEDDIWALSGRCRTLRGLMDQQSKEVQVLLDKMVQVMVRKVYIEGIFKQAKDSQYWELWDRQKLSPEFELKRRRILQLNQELTNKLIELERHFNTLEFNKFGENGGMQGNRRTLQNWQRPSRQIQSLHSLHNTIHSQLAAAEQLSGCLSNQMATLSIETSEKQDAKKKLFESIGLSCAGDTPRSPARDRGLGTPLNKEHLRASGSFSAKEQSRRNQANFTKSEEPETARRRRESLDRSWTSFDPPKTTVKRALLKEDYEQGSANKSFLNTGSPYMRTQAQNQPEITQSQLNLLGTSTHHYKSKGTIEALEQFTENSSTSLYPKSTTFLDSGKQVLSAKPPSHILDARFGQSNARGGGKSIDEKSNSNPAFTGMIDSFAAGASKFVLKSDSGSFALPSLSKQLSENLQTPPGSTQSKEPPKTGFTKLTWDQKIPQAASGASLFDTKVSVTPASTSSSGSSLFSSNNLPSFSSFASKPSSSTFSPASPSSVVANEGSLQAPASTSSSGSSLFSSNKVPSFSSFVSKPSLSTPSSSGASAVANEGLLQAPASTSSSGSSLFSSNKVPSFSSFVSKPSSSTLFPVTPPSSGASVIANEGPSQPLTSSLSFPSTVTSSTQGSNISSVLHSSSTTKPDTLTPVSSPFGARVGSKTEDAPQKETSVVNVSSKIQNEASASASQPGLAIPVSDSKSELSESTTPAGLTDISKSGSQIDLSASSKSSSVVTPVTKLELPSGTEAVSTIAQSTEGVGGSSKSIVSDVSHEEEMEEEAPETNQTTEFAIGNLNAFGLGGTPTSTLPKSNPFGVESLKSSPAFGSAPYAPASSGQLFRPASFSFQTPIPQPSASPQPTANLSGGFSVANPIQVSAAAGFGQPANVGAGQQALGSVLGSFGQSRQIGAGAPGSNVASASGFGNSFMGASGAGFGGGFASAASGGGFASLASGGGFAGAATAGGGFAATATAGSGFAAAAPVVGGFAGGGFSNFGNQQPQSGGGGGFSSFGNQQPQSGGFSGFGNQQPQSGGFSSFGNQQPQGGAGGFSSFGNQQPQGGGFSAFGGDGSGMARPTSQLFTQMRK